MVTLTDIAAKKVGEFLSTQEQAEAGLRVAVRGGGCSRVPDQLALDGQRGGGRVVGDRGHPVISRASAPSSAEARRLKPKWTFTSPTGGMTGTPVVAHGTVVIGSSRGTVYALNPRTGAVRWSYRLRLPEYTYLTSSAAISGDDVYVA